MFVIASIQSIPLQHMSVSHFRTGRTWWSYTARSFLEHTHCVKTVTVSGKKMSQQLTKTCMHYHSFTFGSNGMHDNKLNIYHEQSTVVYIHICGEGAAVLVWGSLDSTISAHLNQCSGGGCRRRERKAVRIPLVTPSAALASLSCARCGLLNAVKFIAYSLIGKWN